jgi:hypothetical protein
MGAMSERETDAGALAFIETVMRSGSFAHLSGPAAEVIRELHRDLHLAVHGKEPPKAATARIIGKRKEAPKADLRFDLVRGADGLVSHVLATKLASS